MSFTEVSKTFPDGTAALTGITFEVRAGEFVTVVGPSGCGKSTLLSVASSLIPHTSGDVNVKNYQFRTRCATRMADRGGRWLVHP